MENFNKNDHNHGQSESGSGKPLPKYNGIAGIDLGTTNSCIVVIENNMPRILPNMEGRNITPSVVGFSYTKESGITTTIGISAQRQAILNHEGTIFVFKRLMGQKFEDIKHLTKLLPFKVVADEDGFAAVEVFGKIYKAVYISSIFLKGLVSQASTSLGYQIEEVVITVPANFNDAQRNATKAAGTIAGLNVRRIINEPTAAALAYGIEKQNINGKKILIYDLGGGTFDVSILEVMDGVFEVRGTEGDDFLGGEDFDNKIVEYVMAKFKEKEGIDLTDNTNKHRIKEDAKRVKEDLSSVESTNLNVLYVAAGPKHINEKITRLMFEDMIRPMIDKTIKIVKQVLAKANLEASDIARIVLVGGSTRIPLIRKVLSDLFKVDIYSDVNPDEVVAIGAAYQGAVFTGQQTNLVLLDVTPLNIGIETLRGCMTPIIEANSKIPSISSKTFTTTRDNQTEVDIKIYQGNRPMVSDNKLLAVMNLAGIRPAPRNEPKIVIQLEIDANGIFKASAYEEGGDMNLKKEITLTISNTLNDENIKKMKEEADAQAENDKQLKVKMEAIAECDGLVYEIEKKIKDIKNETDKKDYESQLSNIRSNIESDPLESKNKLQTLYNTILSKPDNSNQSTAENTETSNEEDKKE